MNKVIKPPRGRPFGGGGTIVKWGLGAELQSTWCIENEFTHSILWRALDIPFLIAGSVSLSPFHELGFGFAKASVDFYWSLSPSICCFMASIRSSSLISLIVLYRKSIEKWSISLWVYDVMTLTHQKETVYDVLSLSMYQCPDSL